MSNKGHNPNLVEKVDSNSRNETATTSTTVTPLASRVSSPSVARLGEDAPSQRACFVRVKDIVFTVGERMFEQARQGREVSDRVMNCYGYAVSSLEDIRLETPLYWYPHTACLERGLTGEQIEEMENTLSF